MSEGKPFSVATLAERWETAQQQLDLIERITKRYKENGGYIYVIKGPIRVRVSLADFILTEVPALRRYLDKPAVKQSLTTGKKSLRVR